MVGVVSMLAPQNVTSMQIRQFLSLEARACFAGMPTPANVIKAPEC
jgi:hypothetical protein